MTMLHEFITAHREDIIERCRARVGTRSIPPPTIAEIEHGVPVFLDQLVTLMRLGLQGSPEIGKTAFLHGHDLRLQGFTVAQVVHDYGDVCQSITELAMETGAPISTSDFHTLNRCLDDAIAGAVTQYARVISRSSLEGESARESEGVGFLDHELRNLTNTALIAFGVLKTGNVGVGGSTGAVLNRSLMGLSALVGRSHDEARLRQTVERPERFLVSEFIARLEPFPPLAAMAKGITFTVMPVDDGLAVEGDRQVLSAAVGNLLQNAFKFTKPQSTITLRVGASADRVRIEVQDECGGLPCGNVTDPSRSSEQRSAERSGWGLGLPFTRWAVEANHGRLYARTLPDTGCVFTVDLPRLS
jgi:signal transduction histidine kinase